MFSENNRISGRQMYRLMTYDLLGIGTLLVPQMLAKAAGRDGILSIGIGMAAALMYLWILRRIAPPAQESYPEYMERQLGRIGGGIVQTGYLIYLVLLAGYWRICLQTLFSGIFCAENRFIWSFRLSCCWCCMDLRGESRDGRESMRCCSGFF